MERVTRANISCLAEFIPKRAPKISQRFLARLGPSLKGVGRPIPVGLRKGQLINFLISPLDILLIYRH